MLKLASALTVPIIMLGCAENDPHSELIGEKWTQIVINYSVEDPISETGIIPANNRVVITDVDKLKELKMLYGSPTYSYMYNSVDSKLGNIEIHLSNKSIWIYEFPRTSSNAIVHPPGNPEPTFNVDFENRDFALKLRDYLRDETGNEQAQFFYSQNAFNSP